MELLWRFSALSMCCCAVLTLLREGTLRRTAVFVGGVLLVSLWVDGVGALLPSLRLDAVEAPETVLTEVRFVPSDSAEEVYARRAEGESLP